MPLKPGIQLGPYEILAPLGAGGMGEVYRARDTRLQREVAVKVLPASFAADAERLRRFELEARTTGMLNHPNILAVHDVGTHEGAPYLVTELLDGRTLREELPTPRRKALDYARQVAAGLAAAHAKGITHRDLKPENLFVTTDGRVKILDFGLAKVAEDEAAELTRTAGTTPGVVLGTVGYMSPEQALGKSADHRSDIFSLGAILYEMLGGKRAFQRDSAPETLTAVIKDDPPPLADAGLERIVRRCIEKSPEQRFQSASDLGFAMSSQSDALSGSVTNAGAAPATTTAQRSRWPWLAAVAAVIAFAAGFFVHSLRVTPAENWVGVHLGGPNVAWCPRVSPDGKLLAFQAFEGRQAQVAVMNPETGNWTFLTHDRGKGVVWGLSWSHDNSRVYFDRYSSGPRGIYSVAALGGDQRTILEDAGIGAAMPDGSLITYQVNADRKMQLHRFWPETSRLDALNAEAVGAFTRFAVFPDGEEGVYFGRPLQTTAPTAPTGYYVLDLISGASRPLASNLKSIWFFYQPPVAIPPGGNSTIAVERVGDEDRIVEIPRHASSPAAARTLFSVQSPIWQLDAGPDGNIYTDQMYRPGEILRFPVSGGIPESQPGEGDQQGGIVQLSDGRALFFSALSGKRRLMGASPGKDPAPLVQTEEANGAPFARVGERVVAFELGLAPNQTIALASVPDGRMVRRLDATKGLNVESLAASPDGNTLYYVVSGTIWAIPSAGGAPRKIAPGDVVAADSNGHDVIALRNEKDGVRLVRVSLSGGPETPIPFHGGEYRLSNTLSPDAVNADGRILVYIQSPDSWWDEVGILDPKTGDVTRVDVAYSGDIDDAGWTRDGKIIAQGFPLRSSLWRFRREGKP